MPTVSMRQLLEAGVHFGHQTRRWNPKMKPYIFAERNGIHIIDLAQTVKRLDAALEFVTETVAGGGTVLFVGTKKQAQETVMQEAIRAGLPYVNKRWLGGMLTNFVTIRKRIGLLDQLEARQLAGDFDRLPEEGGRAADRGAQQAPGDARRHPQDEAAAGRDLHRRPAPRADRRHRGEQARDPGRRHGDTNVDPDEIDYIIPANDDAIRAIRLLCQLVADACSRARSCGPPGATSPRSPTSRPRTTSRSSTRPQPRTWSPSSPPAGRCPSTRRARTTSSPRRPENTMRGTRVAAPGGNRPRNSPASEWLISPPADPAARLARAAALPTRRALLTKLHRSTTPTKR